MNRILTCQIITNNLNSITKLMGESFKLHSHALTGYEDAMMAEQPQGTPDPMPAPHAAAVAAY
jgi:hypothetical protein